MAQIRRVLRCQACGAILQCDHKNEPGFISRSIIENEVPKIPYCNACYEKIIALNNSQPESQVDKNLLKILKDPKNANSLVVWIIDLFSFNGTLNLEVAKRVKKHDVVVLGNKVDLFSPSQFESLTRFIDERFSEYGINPLWITLLSKKNKINSNDIVKKLHEYRKNNDVLFIGNNGSGKTTILRNFLENYKIKSKKEPVETTFPETEVPVFSIPLSGNTYLYELPDLSNETSVVSKVEKDVLKIIVPKKEVLMRRYIIGKGTTIVVGGLAMFSILEGPKTASYRIFTSEKVEIRTVTNDKANAKFTKIISKNSLSPVSKNYTKFEDFDLFDYDLDNDDLRHDIGIEGYCWLSTRGRGQTIRILLPKGVALKECLSKIR